MKFIPSKKLKIAFVSDAIYPYNKGGKEKRIYELSTRLAKTGYDVNIYCMKWWKEQSNHRLENGVHLHAISKYYPLYSGKRRSITQALLFACACLKLIKEDFDIIEVDHMPHFVLFSTKIVTLIKGKKLYATWNEVWGRDYWKKYLGKLGTIAYIIEWVSARMPDKIISVSKHTKDKLEQDLKVKKDILVIPNGINLKEIQKVQPAKEKSDIIFAGRLLSHKNIDVLIKSVAILKKEFPKIKTLIIGEGPEKKQLENLVKKLNLETNINFLGFFQNHHDLYSYIKASKLFIFPSTREGFGIVALEANTCGVPVITVDHKDNATKDLISNGINGSIVKLSASEISNKASDYLHKKNKPNYKKFINQYDWETISKNLESFYNYEK